MMMQNELNKVANLSERLHEALSLRNFSVSDLALLAHVEEEDIRRCLSGDLNPNDLLLYMMAYILEVDEKWLAGYDVPRDKFRMSDIADSCPWFFFMIRTIQDVQFQELILKISCLKKEQLKVIESLVDKWVMVV